MNILNFSQFSTDKYVCGRVAQYRCGYLSIGVQREGECPQEEEEEQAGAS